MTRSMTIVTAIATMLLTTGAQSNEVRLTAQDRRAVVAAIDQGNRAYLNNLSGFASLMPLRNKAELASWPPTLRDIAIRYADQLLEMIGKMEAACAMVRANGWEALIEETACNTTAKDEAFVIGWRAAVESAR